MPRSADDQWVVKLARPNSLDGRVELLCLRDAKRIAASWRVSFSLIGYEVFNPQKQFVSAQAKYPSGTVVEFGPAVYVILPTTSPSS